MASSVGAKQSLLSLSEVAALVERPRLHVWWWWKVGDPSFPEPAESIAGAPLWAYPDLVAWMLARRGERMGALVPVRDWPAPTSEYSYYGAHEIPGGILQVWSSDGRHLVVAWPLAGELRVFAQMLNRLRAGTIPATGGRFDGMGVDAVVVVGATFGGDGPSLRTYRTGGRAHVRARNAGDSEQGDYLGWSGLSRVLGQPAPFWADRLRQASLISGWAPGQPEVLAAASPDMDVTVLLRMAAVFPPGHPAAVVLTHLVQVDAWRGYEAAKHELEEMVADTLKDPATMVIAARPMPVPEVGAGDLDQPLRRLGWVDVLNRTDALAAACVVEVMRWDGGKDFPYSQPEQIGVSTRAGREWQARLTPATRTAAFHILERDNEGEALEDPLTGAPVLRTPSGKLLAAIPQRLPAAAPLKAVILGHPIWVRTQDGKLWPAPLDSYFGLSWGYSGSGPSALAVLLDRLLDDITAQAADTLHGAPAGLEALTVQPFPDGTVLTRAQLEAARRGQQLHLLTDTKRGDDRPGLHPDDLDDPDDDGDEDA